jgi:S-DNA-T family DNA segregation ATPase FtsK/SpoIIIE
VAQLGPGPGTRGEGVDLSRVEHIAGADVTALREWAAESAGRPAVVVVDDVTALPEATADALTGLTRPAGELVVLAAGGAPELAGAFRGPTVALRRSRTALLLRPAAGDAQLLGLRVPRAPLPARPGSGWLVAGGAVTRVQVARRRVAASAGGRAQVPHGPVPDGPVPDRPVVDRPVVDGAVADWPVVDSPGAEEAVTSR